MSQIIQSSSDLEQNEEPLLLHTHRNSSLSDRRTNSRIIAVLSLTCLFLLSLAALLTFNVGDSPSLSSIQAPETVVVSRGKKEGVSEKVFRQFGSGGKYGQFHWTNEMLKWQRTGYHFQPQKNWMNDPNGPLYHKGYYHLFYQYNPDSAVWGNITWGHAVSTDLIHWKYLPISLIPDHWYDINGVWSGSATILPDGNIKMLYTGDTDDFVQVQNLAYPANLSDPLLLEWIKHPSNPVMTPPKGIGSKDFRDPTTAWIGPDGVWRLAIGSMINKKGFSFVYKTTDFESYELVDHVLHEVPGTGMWECVDFYPLSTTSENGLDTSVNGPGIKHLLKASLDDEKVDYYALGTYDMSSETWVPDYPDLDVGLGLKYDYGKYYASKTFYDPIKSRRILWGWIGETDSEADDLLKGWSSVQTIPRVVTYDQKTKTNIKQWPVEEVEDLRSESVEFESIVLKPGSIVNLNLTNAAQLDISAEFSVDAEALKTSVGDDVINNCSTAAVRQAVGPFGLLVLADDSLSELTPVYFHIAKASDGTLKNWFCTDLSRSSEATTVDKELYGGPVPVLEDENYTMRLLVDHSIVEGFGQGGRTCITSRVYPTKAINGAVRVFLFNNATDLSVTASVNIWRLKSVDIVPF